jgi:hypothetical protein
MNNLTNIHPADELAALREEMKIMGAREDELRAILLKDGADLNGDQYTAAILPSTRETVDKNALVAELGRETVARFLKTSNVRTVKLVPRQKE